MLNKLSRETLADQAARNLMAFIEAENLKPGKWLPSENQLAADLGVSRPIIREALKSLEGKGIIEVVSGKGAIVRPLDGEALKLFFQRAVRIEREAVIDLMELRKAIEIQCVELAAQRRTDEELARLGQIVAEMRCNLHATDAYVALDVAFHAQIAAMTHNTMMYYLVGPLRETLNEALHESLLRPLTDEQLERVQAGHEQIFQSIAQGNAGEAQRTMALHFNDAVISLLTRSLDAEPPPAPSA